MITLAPPLRDSRERQRRRRRRRRILWWGLAIPLIVFVLLLGVPLLLGAVRADALPSTTVLGAEVGGLSGEQLEAALSKIATQRESDPLHVERGLVEGQVSASARVLDATAGDAGYEFDVGVTLAAVTAHGRQANPLAAIRDHWRSWREGLVVEPAEGIDQARLDAWAAETSERLGVEPIEGEVRIDGADVTRVDPEPGIVVDAQALAQDARQAAITPGPDTVTAEVRAVEPETTTAEVDRVGGLAEAALAGPITLERDDVTVSFSPEEIGSMLTVTRDGGDLDVSISSERIASLVDEETRTALARDPVDAEITLEGSEIRISESRDGFRFDLDALTAQIGAITHGEAERTGTLEGEIVRPDLSTEEAHDLGIVEEVSSFTTQFQPGQSRVTNIQLMADMVHGAVLKPGETFSVNDHVGERTEDKGFVGGGAILRGEFVEQIGGGVSQFATTMYNAAYFGGYEILEHQAHSYYISRYPAGREATLNFPTIDLEIRNNSPHGLLIATDHTASSVTVSMWGTTWVEVDSVAGDRTRIRSGEVRDGFDIVVTRVLRYPDGREEREEQFTRYFPEDRPD